MCSSDLFPSHDIDSWVCATPRLTELFTEPMIWQSEQTYRKTLQTILLRDKEKELIDYDDTQKTKSMRRIVEALNRSEERRVGKEC